MTRKFCQGSWLLQGIATRIMDIRVQNTTSSVHRRAALRCFDIFVRRWTRKMTASFATASEAMKKKFETYNAFGDTRPLSV